MKRKYISIILIACMFLSVTSSYSEVTLDASVTLTRSVRDDKTDFVLNNIDSSLNMVTIDYIIQPEPIEIDMISLDYPLKEIVLVIDKSGSMGQDVSGGTKGNSRIALTKKAANRFVEMMKVYPNVKVSLVEYSTTASVFTYDGRELLDVSNSNDFFRLTNEINGISTGGGTNVGDAIRRSQYILDNGSDAQKYMVFLSDGEPQSFSATSLSYGSSHKFAKGNYYYDGGKKKKKVSSLSNVTFLTGPGDANNYFVNNSSTGDLGGYALEYSKVMIKQLDNSGLDVKSYFIGFSDVVAANKLEKISKEINGYYKSALTGTEIDEVYQDIASEIVADLHIDAIDFTEKVPNGLEYVPGSDNMTLNGDTLSRSFDNISYFLNAEKTHYIAEPITFSITFNVIEAGEYDFESKNSVLTYTDFNAVIKMKQFNALQVIANRDQVQGLNSVRIPFTNKNELTWSEYPGALGYKIYKVVDGEDVLISNNAIGLETSLEIAIESDDYDTTVYKVEAVIAANLSEKGEVVADTLADILELNVTRKSDVFTLEWKPVEGATKYMVRPSVDGRNESEITINAPTLVGGKVRYEYTLPTTLVYGDDDAIKFIVDAEKTNSPVREAESIEFLLKPLVESVINSDDISDFKYAINKDVHISYQSSNFYPLGFTIFDPLLVLELNLPNETTLTPLEYTYSTLEVYNGAEKLEATVVKSNSANVKIYVELDDFKVTGLPKDTTIDLIANFGVGYVSENGQLTNGIFEQLVALNDEVKIYNIGEYIESLLDAAYVTPRNQLLEIKSYVLYNSTDQVTDGVYTRNEITGLSSGYIQLKNKEAISTEY